MSEITTPYRITLFKKKLRDIIGAHWLRFYYSKGRCHLCIMASDLGDKNTQLVIKRLKKGRIEFELDDWGDYSKMFGSGIRSICIPIDQEALPESRRE
jgi:hypothetical protein